MPGDFVEDIVDSRQVLFRLFQAKLRKALPGFKASDARCLFDNGAPVMRLGAKQLPDALLLDNGVGFRPKPGAHEDVLDIAQAAKFAVEQVFAFAGAKQTAGDDDFALARGSLEAAAADLQRHGVFCRL